jgi:hypothetical protein
MMTIDSPHVGLWSALTTLATATAAFLIRVGAQWGQMLAKLDDLQENQQVIADKVGVVLPHPFVRK